VLSAPADGLDTAAGLVAALEPFRPADAPLRRHLVSPEPADAPHRLASRRVREVMATGVLTVSEDTPVLELAEILANCHLPAVPVVDATGRVTGMVSAADLEQWRFAAVSV
jgi:CBS-domain-containing membrane protein